MLTLARNMFGRRYTYVCVPVYPVTNIIDKRKLTEIDEKWGIETTGLRDAEFRRYRYVFSRAVYVPPRRDCHSAIREDIELFTVNPRVTWGMNALRTVYSRCAPGGSFVQTYDYVHCEVIFFFFFTQRWSHSWKMRRVTF